MCGIAGIVEREPSATVREPLLRRMTELLSHRGPDDAGHFLTGNVGLGHRRLSIIDLSPGGHQPMANADGSIWITYNGECYNYVELGRRLEAQGVQLRSGSDTEVLLKLYELQGERFLEAVDGMFALAIWDGRHRKLLLARDRLGIKPLYYHAGPRRFLFASEMKALLADPELSTDIDVAALGDYFHLLSIPDPRSILRGVKKLRPGHYLTVTQGGIEERRYWELPIAIDAGMPLEEASRQFERRFSDAVRSHMVADVPVGGFLSGGVDSSSIVAAASAVTAQPLQTFSITFPGLAEFDESPFAARVAAHCGARHHEFALAPNLVEALPRIAWHADEPFAVSSGFAVYFLAKLAREHVKVVLSGDGSDEVFGGYPWRHADYSPMGALYASAAAGRVAALLRSTPLASVLPGRIRARLDRMRGRDDRYVNSLTCYSDEELTELLTPSYATEVVRAWRDNTVQRCLDSVSGAEQLAGKLYTDIKTTLVSEMLTKVDRMTMAHGLEARVPFLDHHLVEWAFTVPSRNKLAGGEGKLLVKKAMEKHLPREILYRPKQGFNVPLEVWLRGELKEFIRDQLFSSRLTSRGILDRHAVSRILDDHFSGRRDASNRIFVMLMLELWFQQFIDRRAELAAR